MNFPNDSLSWFGHIQTATLPRIYAKSHRFVARRVTVLLRKVSRSLMICFLIYSPWKFLVCGFVDRLPKSRIIKMWVISSNLERTSLVDKRFIISRTIIFAGTKLREGKIAPLKCSVSKSEHMHEQDSLHHVRLKSAYRQPKKNNV